MLLWRPTCLFQHGFLPLSKLQFSTLLGVHPYLTFPSKPGSSQRSQCCHALPGFLAKSTFKARPGQFAGRFPMDGGNPLETPPGSSKRCWCRGSRMNIYLPRWRYATCGSLAEYGWRSWMGESSWNLKETTISCIKWFNMEEYTKVYFRYCLLFIQLLSWYLLIIIDTQWHVSV